MTIDDFRHILEGSPTEGAARCALAALSGLARDGNLEATLSLVHALSRELDDGAETQSRAELVAMEGVPPLLRIYATLLQPRAILTDADELSRLSAEPIPAASFVGLQRLILAGSVLQHEALKAFVLCALLRQFALWAGQAMSPGSRLEIVDRVWSDTRVVPGENADASLRFGRDLLLRLRGAEAFFFIVHHELGHNVLNAMLGGRSAAASHAAGEPSDIRGAIAGLLDSARRLRDAAIRPGDPRAFRTASGLKVLCTLIHRPGGDYFHWSLTDQAGPIDLAAASSHAFSILAALGVGAPQSAAAYDSRGMFHFGFRADLVDSNTVPMSPFQPGSALTHAEDGAAGGRWMDELRVAGRLGTSAGEIAPMLGVVPREPTVYGTHPDRTLADHELISGVRALDPLPPLTRQQAQAVLGASWRGAEPVLLRRVLKAWPDPRELLHGSGLPLADIGASLCAVRDESGVACYGPGLESINDVLRTLHEFGAALDGRADQSGRTLLTRAVARGVAPVRLLLECGVDVNRPDGAGETPLLTCATLGMLDVAEALTAAHADVDARDRQGNTAAHRASAHGHPRLLRVLLAHGAEADGTNGSGETPLMVARTAEVVDVLCEYAVSVDASTPDGTTALMNAAGGGRAAVVVALLARGADPDAANRLGETAMHHSVTSAASGRECVEALLDAGADVDEETNEGVTPLMVAAGGGQLALMELLLQRGARVNATTRTGNTAMIMASDGRNEWTRDPSFGDRIEACLRRLVVAGADVNAANDAGTTPLQAATWGFDAGRVRLLLELGADANLASRDGITPLAVAADKGHGMMIEALISAGAKIDARDAEGNTPLLRALKAGRAGADAVQSLLRAGADVTHRNGLGDSALDLVANSVVDEAVRTLVQEVRWEAKTPGEETT